MTKYIEKGRGVFAKDETDMSDTTEFYESNYSFSIADTTNGAHGDYRIKSYFESLDAASLSITSVQSG